MDIKDITRRNFIQRLTLFGAAGVGAGSLLAACGGGEQPAATPTETPAAETPAEAPVAEGFTCTDTSGITDAERAAREALHYVDTSTMEGKQCDNCILYVAAAEGAQCGTCQTIKGPIHPEGNCDIWAAQTA